MFGNHVRNGLILLLNTIGLFLSLGIIFSQSLENIAFNKQAFQSSTWRTWSASKAVDGNIDTYSHGNQEPNSLNWWKVDLLSAYYISQVILTPRQDYDGGRMDYVFIGISNSPNISGAVEYPLYPLCRQSPYKVYQIIARYQSMSISCRPNTPPGRYVFVQQPTNSPGFLTISEIQVYGIRLEIDSLGSNICQGNYYGDKCDKYCNCDKGVKCDQQGICPNGCDANWEGEHCDIRKFKDNQLLGCFEFSDSSDHQFTRVNSQSCIVTCSGYGFTFTANMTSDACICTSNMNWTKPCQENCSPQNCQTFYSVCPNGTYGYDCTLKCNCLNNGRCSYMEGRCEDGCASGWSGASCDVRDCSKYNGGCGINEDCVSNSSDVTSCQCKEGYNKTSALSSCQIVVPKTTKELDKSAIIGGVIGSITGLCLIIAVILLFVKFRKRLKNTNFNTSLFVVKPWLRNGIESSNKEATVAERTFKLPGIQKFIEDNAPNYIDEFQKVNLYVSPYVKHSKEGKAVIQLNRFKNIVPYDHNRVKLMRKPNENQSDYINASYIENDQQRSLIHLHFTEWPDHGVPNNIFYLLDFCRRCQKLYEREKCGVVTHCSAGVGRTGSFLAIYDLLVKGHQGLDLSVPETVNNLRKQRMKMVEKQAQYNFIYEALIEEAKLGPTCFSKDEFTKFYKTLKDGFLESIERSHMLYQHQILNKFYSNDENKEEVRFTKIITSAYNFCLMTNDISSITWQNIRDTQCIITFDPTVRNNIIPKVDHPIINGQVCISLVNETNSEWGKVFEVQKKGDNVSNYENIVVDAYENISTSRDKIIKIFMIDKKEDYLDFLTFMELFSQLPQDANIAIILGNNLMLGYYFVAACNIISQLKVYDEVAILQNLCELCKVTEYQPSQISFEKLHKIVHDFILTSG